MNICIESDKDIMLKSWCGKLANCAHNTATKIGLSGLEGDRIMGFWKRDPM
jgi:hypothetical protein